MVGSAVWSALKLKSYANFLVNKSELILIGNSMNSVRMFEVNTGVKALPGGVEKHALSLEKAAYFINCVGVDKLDNVIKVILQCMPKRILVEKPGFDSIYSALEEKKF